MGLGRIQRTEVRCMKRCGFSASFVLVLMMIFGAVAPMPAISAAQSTSHILLGKVQVTWSAPWERDVDSGGVGGTYEQLWIDAPAGSVMVEVDVPAVPGEQLRDNFLAAFANEVPLQQVDQGSYDDMTYSVDLIPFPGAPVGAFTLVREAPDYSMMILLIASTDSFAEAFASAQTGVTVDGDALFSGVDGATMQQRLTAAASAQSGAGLPEPAQTPTPPTGLNPDTPVAPTPAGTGQMTPTPAAAAQITPTPAAPVAGAIVPVIPNTAREEGSASSPVTLSSNGWTIAWTEGWVNEYVDPISTTLWSSSERASFTVYHFDFVEPSAAAFSQSELEFLTGDNATAPWTIESAVEVVPGSRFHVVFSRTTNSEKFYSVYDVVVEDGAMTASILEAWDTEVMSALSTVQQSVTINGAPAMPGVVLSFATPPASNDDFSYSLIPSGRVVEWTGAWVEMSVYYETLSLRGPFDEVPVFAAIDREVGDEPDVTAAEWVVEAYEGGDPGWTAYKTMDLDNGQRLFVVMQSADGTQFRFHDIDLTGALRKEQYMLVNSDAVADHVAWVQANVTIDGAMPFADIQTLVPELFAGASTDSQAQSIAGNGGVLSVA